MPGTSSSNLPPLPTTRPNIVFVFADQWRACSTGYAGDPNVKTPNLDKLAASSLTFTHAVSGCPVSTPYRASLMTGQLPTTNGMFLNDAHLPDTSLSLGKTLKAAGYDTGFVGNWHLNGGGRLSWIPPGSRQGFDYWKAIEWTHDYNKAFYYEGDDTTKKIWPGYDAFAQTDDVCRYIKGRIHSDRPFAMFLAWGPPHAPYDTAPEEYRKLYDPALFLLRPNVPSHVAAHACSELAGYYAHCSALDACMGRLRAAMADAGLEKNTILVFTSSHGDMLGSHGMEGKQKPWDESLRVPMLWHYPAVLGAEAKQTEAVISSEDLMPTLLGLCGVKIPSGVDGFDYSGLMRGGETPNADNAALISCVAPFGEWSRQLGGREFRGVRTDTFTYVREMTGPWLLYDDESDPYQETNLVGRNDYAMIQDKLEELLSKRLEAVHDKFLSGNTYITQWGYLDADATGTLPVKP